MKTITFFFAFLFTIQLIQAQGGDEIQEMASDDVQAMVIFETKPEMMFDYPFDGVQFRTDSLDYFILKTECGVFATVINHKKLLVASCEYIIELSEEKDMVITDPITLEEFPMQVQI